MQVNNQGTVNIVIDSSTTQKLNLQLGQTYEARVFSVSEDGKVVIKIGGTELVAESKVPLQPGQKILVEVKDNTNGLIVLQLKNNLSLADISQSNLIRESIINNLVALKLPLKEENIVISQGLIKYNLRVSSENIQKVLNGLISSGYQNELSDYNIVESGVSLFAKGLPITQETIELARFLKHEKGQVINTIAKSDNEIDNIMETVIKNLQNSEGESNNQKLPKAVLKEVLTNLPNKLGQELLEKLDAKGLFEQEPFVADKGKEGETVPAVNTSNNLKTSNPVKDNAAFKTNNNLTNDLLNSNSKELIDSTTGSTEIINANKAKEIKLDNQEQKTSDVKQDTSINRPISDAAEENRATIKTAEADKVIASEKAIANLKTLTDVKELLTKALLNLEPKESNNNTTDLIQALKAIAKYMVDGNESLQGDLQETVKGSLKDLAAKILLDNVLNKQETIQTKNGSQHPAETILKEQLGKLEGNLNEINKHFEAVKLYNTGISDSAKDNLNNYYLLSLPTMVAGEKFDNKVYFWSQGNKKRKIDPENMRIVLCLNTNSLGLLKIDLTVAKRDIYAGIEVTDQKVQDFIQGQSSELEQQLATHKYRLKNINCTLKKPEDISPTPSPVSEHFTALDLRI